MCNPRVGTAVLVWCGLLTLACGAETATQASPFLEQVRQHYATWDADHDGRLEANEIELTVTNSAVKGDAAAAIVALRRVIRADKSRGGFTLAEIEAAIPFRSGLEPPLPQFEEKFAAAQARISQTPRKLFVSKEPRLDTLGQGRLGDCFLLAALGSCVHRDPQRIVRMMELIGEDQVAVTLGTGRRIVLPLPTDGEIALGASTQFDGLWANVLEKAIGLVYLERSKSGRHATPFSIIGVGGSPATVLGLLTGHKTRRYGCEDLQQPDIDPAEREAKLTEIRQVLIKAQDDGRMFVGGTAPKGKQTLVPGLYYNHSYGVLGYDVERDEVTFWNPFGNKYTPRGSAGLAHGFPTSHGRFSMPLADAVMWFGSFSIETDEPLDAN